MTLIAFQGVFSNGFVNFDDDLYVTGNPRVQKGLSWDNAGWALTTFEASNWHPLTWLSHMLDAQLFGLDAGKHHFTSLLLHAVNALLVLFLLVRMTGALWRSALAAFLFALHPLHVESVAWIAERKDVLSALLWLSALAAWIGYTRSRRPAPYALTLVLYALSLMAKPMAVTLPFTLLLLDYWPLRRLPFPGRGHPAELKALVWEKAPLFAMSAASCAVTLAAQHVGGAMKTLEAYAFDERLANAAVSYGSYLGKLFWPASLAVFYPHPHPGLGSWTAIGSLLALTGVTAAAFRLAGRAPYFLFGWLWYLGTLVPVIGLVQVGEQALADRYTYMPLLGPFIAIAWGLGGLADRFPRARTAAAGLAAAVLAALLLLTRAQAGAWSDSETLFRHALAGHGDNALAHTSLGLALYEKGRPDEAMSHYREALRIDPGFFDARNNLGNALAKAGRKAEAIEQYREALRILPDSPKVLANLGLALMESDRLPEAAEYLEKAAKAAPESTDMEVLIGTALLKSGRTAEAEVRFNRVLAARPASPEALNGLGLVLARSQRLPEAVGRFQEALRAKPDFAEAHENLGVVLQRMGRVPEAIEQLRMALRLRPGSPNILNSLGLACARAGRFSDAAGYLEQVVALRPDFAAAFCNLGVAYDRMDRVADAIRCYERALEIDPALQQARDNLAMARARAGGAPGR